MNFGQCNFQQVAFVPHFKLQSTHENSLYTLDVGGTMPAWDGPLPQTTAEALAAFALEALKENSKEINFLDSLLAAGTMF